MARDDRFATYALGLAITLALIAVLYVWATAPTPNAREVMCARRLGVHWSVEDGATERLDEWGECVNG